MDYNKINPMAYWKNVIRKQPNRAPIVFMADENVKTSPLLLGFMKALVTNVWFDIYPVDNIAMIAPLVGLNYLPAMPRANEWGRYDYAYCSENNYEVILPAMLSGVKCFHSLPELQEEILTIPTSADRVAVYERGRELLDKLKS